MRALLLAAGRGSRMGELTRSGPKCLARLAGRTLLEWQKAALRTAGCGEIAVVGGYEARQLAAPDVELFVNERWESTNMVASLLVASSWFDAGPVIVSYSDIVYHPDAVRALLGTEGELVVAYDRQWLQLWRERFANPLADAESFRVDAGGLLIEIGRRADTCAEIEGQYMGLLRIGTAGFAAIERAVASMEAGVAARLDMTSLLRRLIADGERIRTAPVAGRWCEVDSAADLAAYEARLASTVPWAHDFRWEEGA